MSGFCSDLPVGCSGTQPAGKLVPQGAIYPVIPFSRRFSGEEAVSDVSGKQHCGYSNGLQATADLENGSILLAGPFHPAFGHLVIAEIYRDRVIELLKTSGRALEAITLRVNPKRISAMRGLKNENIHYLKNRFHIRHIDVTGDPLMPDHHIALVTDSETVKLFPVIE